MKEKERWRIMDVTKSVRSQRGGIRGWGKRVQKE